jgi:transcriptional regulator with XRE-family HTH domain
VEQEALEDERLRGFGERVAELRRAGQWNQEALADRAGMHSTYIWQVEKGRRNVALKNLYRLADALGVEITALLSPKRERPLRTT